MNPTALLLATLIGTSAVTLVAQVGKGDTYQARIIGFCVLLATAAGAVRGAELTGFIFAYLLWGCIAGVGGSWILHRLLDWGRLDQESLKRQETRQEKRGNGM